MSTLRKWLSNDEIAQILLDARILHVKVTDVKLALVLELPPDEHGGGDDE